MKNGDQKTGDKGRGGRCRDEGKEKQMKTVRDVFGCGMYWVMIEKGSHRR